jgi:hypothetical protein
MRNSEAWLPSPQLQYLQISTDLMNYKLAHLQMHITQSRTDSKPQRDGHMLSSRARSLTP